jgi:hypothetical protein
MRIRNERLRVERGYRDEKKRRDRTGGDARTRDASKAIRARANDILHG